MYCRVLACVVGDREADAGELGPELTSALADARRHGLVALLVSGRTLADLREAGIDLFGFDAVVSEHGAHVWLAASDRTIRLGEAPPERLLGALCGRNIPFHVGTVAVDMGERHAPALLDVLRELGLDWQLVFDGRALRLLPAGITPAVGVRRALAELGRSERNMVAFAGGEADRTLLATAELAVALRDAAPAATAIADEELAQPGTAGVAAWILRLLVHEGVAPTPSRRRLACGLDAAGAPVTVPSSGGDVLVSGDPRTGKSWLAQQLAERLLEQGYGLLAIDADSEHAALAQRPGVLGLGLELPLPPVEAVGRLLRQPMSVVLHLGALGAAERTAYVHGVLAVAADTRRLTGFPHWTLVDEAHYWLREQAPALRLLDGASGSWLLVTYRPSLLARAVLERADAHIVLPTTVDDERHLVGARLDASGAEGLPADGALAMLGPARAGLLLRDGGGARWRTFALEGRGAAPVPRLADAEALVPEDRAFCFRAADDELLATARSGPQFCAAVRTVPGTSLRRHLLAGDFSRWSRDVLGDDALARGLRKLEETTRAGGPASRGEILVHLHARFGP